MEITLKKICKEIIDFGRNEILGTQKNSVKICRTLCKKEMINIEITDLKKAFKLLLKFKNKKASCKKL